MRANVPDEYIEAIYDYIFSELLLNALEKKLVQYEKEQLKYDYLLKKLKVAQDENIQIQNYLIAYKIKVYPMKDLDDLFVEYDYSIKMDRGFKEGQQRIWKSALKMELNRRLQKLLKS